MDSQDYSQYLKENFHEIDSIYNVVFWGRSGSYLLYSLLDSHPSLLQFPIENWESHYNKLNWCVSSLNSLKTSHSDKPAAMAYLVAEAFPLLLKEWNKHHPHSLLNYEYEMIARIGDHEEESFMGVEKQVYVQHLTDCFRNLINKELPLNRGNLLRIMHVSYACAINKKINTPKPKIVFSLHNFAEEAVHMIGEDFKNTFYLMTVRVPYMALDSHLYHHLFELVDCYPLENYTSLIGAMYKKSFIPYGLKQEQIVAIKFEDLHLNTQDLMTKLCKWMHIDWDDSLLKSTIDGKTWWYNRRGELISGTNKEMDVHPAAKFMNEKDIQYFETLFDSIYQNWEYQRKRPLSTKWKKALSALLLPPMYWYSLQKTWERGLKEKRSKARILKMCVKLTIKVYLKTLLFLIKNKKKGQVPLFKVV